MAKMLVDLQKGLIEVDGDEKFVERVYADIKEALVQQLQSRPTLSGDAEAGGIDGTEEAGKSELGKKGKRRPRGNGPSCASRIASLKGEHFFDEARSSKEVGEKLREKGTTYEQKHVSAALINLTQSGKLRRFQSDGWKYQAS